MGVTFTTADRVIGTVGGGLAAANMLLGGNNGCGNNNGGILGNLFGNNNNCNDSCYVTEKELGYILAGTAKDSTIAELKAEMYSDAKLQTYKDQVTVKFEMQQKEICALDAALATECERRACGDENIVNYVNGNFVKADIYLDSKHVKYGRCSPVLQDCDPCGKTVTP